jgi:hypothetical protein
MCGVKDPVLNTTRSRIYFPEVVLTAVDFEGLETQIY